MSSSATSTIKSFPTSKNESSTTSTNNTENTQSNKTQSSEINDKNSKAHPSNLINKIESPNKNVSFSRDTNFSANHRLLKIDPKTGESKAVDKKNNLALSKKQIKKREALKMRTTFNDVIKIFIYYILLISSYFFMAWIVFCFFNPGELDHPFIHGESSFHGYEAQLIVTPMDKDPKGRGYVVRFDSTDSSTYKLYLEKIKNFLTKFQDTSTSNGRSCKLGDTNKDIHESSTKERQFCFNEENYQNTLPDCTEEHDYGFKYGNPCFILSLNNHLNWIPGTLNETYIIENNLHDIDYNHYIPITCSDDNNPINITQSNKNGINRKYYPFLNINGFHKGYQIIQFYDLTPNTEYNIICTIHTGNDDKKFNNKKNKVTIKIAKSQ